MRLYRYWHGTECACGQVKGKGHWQCMTCHDNRPPSKDALAAACEAHMLAAEAYLESLKPCPRT